MSQLPLLTMPPASWERLDDGSTKFAHWQHHSGWEVVHCGHPTALWPYSLQHPDRAEIVVSFNGRGFRKVQAARDVVERIVSGEVTIIGSRAQITADGTEPQP